MVVNKSVALSSTAHEKSSNSCEFYIHCREHGAAASTMARVLLATKEKILLISHFMCFVANSLNLIQRYQLQLQFPFQCIHSFLFSCFYLSLNSDNFPSADQSEKNVSVTYIGICEGKGKCFIFKSFLVIFFS